MPSHMYYTGMGVPPYIIPSAAQQVHHPPSSGLVVKPQILQKNKWASMHIHIAKFIQSCQQKAEKVGFHKPFVDQSRSHRPGFGHAFQAVGPSSAAGNVPSRQSSFQQPKIDTSEIYPGYRKPSGIGAQHSSVHPPGLLTTVVPHRGGVLPSALPSTSIHSKEKEMYFGDILPHTSRYRANMTNIDRPMDRRLPSEERPPIHGNLNPHPSAPSHPAPHPSAQTHPNVPPHPNAPPHPAAPPHPSGRDIDPAFSNLPSYREQLMKSGPIPPGIGAPPSSKPSYMRPYMHEIEKRLDVDKSRLHTDAMHHAEYVREAERRRIAEQQRDRPGYHNPLYLEMRERSNPSLHDNIGAHPPMSPRRHPVSPPRPLRQTLLRTIDAQHEKSYIDMDKNNHLPPHTPHTPRHDGERKTFPVPVGHQTFSTPVSSSSMLSGFGITSTRYAPVQR